ncbi:MAG: hypothetical protein OXH01_09970 [Bacteroidetes bacterium]|nr:hypothetical protein [Bacteroidota bacterium]
MVRVPLEPLAWPGATAVQVQVQDGDSWTDAGSYSDVGAFPGYVDSVDVVREYTSLPTFRYRWMVGSYSSEWSGSWSLGALAPLYIWVVDLRDLSDSQYVTGSSTVQLYAAIRAAKTLLDSNLGPFQTSKEGWPDAIRLAMRRQVEFQLMMESPDNITFFSGLSSEQVGSYSYERDMTHAGDMTDYLGSVPDHVEAILDPYADNTRAQAGYRTELPQIFEPQKFPKLPPKIEESKWRREGVQ